jgi:uncharacterized protein YcnI
MSTKNICLALVALVLTSGVATVAHAHHGFQQASATANCTTTYSTAIDADGHSVSNASLTCSRPAQRLASGAAL